MPQHRRRSSAKRSAFQNQQIEVVVGPVLVGVVRDHLQMRSQWKRDMPQHRRRSSAKRSAVQNQQIEIVVGPVLVGVVRDRLGGGSLRTSLRRLLVLVHVVP
jgi:hypothetical protein